MTKPVWHCHIAMSLDGKIARSDGSFDWLMPYPPQEFDIDAFHAEVDAVVMGTHGRKGFDRLLVGSVAEKVLRDAPCTVIIVKPKADA